MGLFDFLRGNRNDVPKNDPRIGSLNEDKYQQFDRDYLDALSKEDLVSDFIKTDGLNDLWQMSSDRSTYYQSLDSISHDSIISSALEMYADDSSQYDADNRVVWVESDDEFINNYLNGFIKSTRLGGHLWSMYYSLAKYGDVYIKLYKYREKSIISNDEIQKGKEVIKYEKYFSVVEHPENVFDLSHHGKTAYFAVVEKPDEHNTMFMNAKMGKQELKLYPADQYVHVYLDKPDSRVNNQVSITIEDAHGDRSEDVDYFYDVVDGKSMLADIYPVQRQIQLLETSLILNRLSKAAITRIVSIEVGDMPSTDVSAALRRVKSALENRVSFDTKNGMNDYMTPGGLDNIVVVPTREGKGALNQETIGGDVDVKSITDLDYFNNKRFGGLKIPKAFLGYEESLGNNGGGTLTKQDIRYGRTIKRLQTAMVSGLTQMMVNLLKNTAHHTPKDLTNFVVKVVPPTTSDDDERDAMNDAKFKVANNIIELLQDNDAIDKTKLMKYVFTDILSEPELVSTLKMTKDDEDGLEEPADLDDAGDDGVDLDTTPVDDKSSSPAPKSDLPDDVTPSVSQQTTNEPTDSGDELKSSSQTVTVPSQGSAIQ